MMQRPVRTHADVPVELREPRARRRTRERHRHAREHARDQQPHDRRGYWAVRPHKKRIRWFYQTLTILGGCAAASRRPRLAGWARAGPMRWPSEWHVLSCASCAVVADLLDRWTEHKDATVPDFVLGQYVIDDPAGIRSHPYSTSAYVVHWNYTQHTYSHGMTIVRSTRSVTPASKP